MYGTDDKTEASMRLIVRLAWIAPADLKLTAVFMALGSKREIPAYICRVISVMMIFNRTDATFQARPMQ